MTALAYIQGNIQTKKGKHALVVPIAPNDNLAEILGTRYSLYSSISYVCAASIPVRSKQANSFKALAVESRPFVSDGSALTRLRCSLLLSHLQPKENVS